MSDDKKLEIDGTVYESEFDILHGGDFTRVTEEKIEDQHRWWNQFSRVVKHEKTGRFFNILWCRNASESQDGQELDPYVYEEVTPVEKVVTVYEKLQEESR